VAGSVRLNLLWDPRVHPVLMASVLHLKERLEQASHRRCRALGSAAISGRLGRVAVHWSVRFVGRDAVLLHCRPEVPAQGSGVL